MSRKVLALGLSLLVGTSLSMTALPSEADSPTPSPKAAPKVVYESYTYSPASAVAMSSMKKVAASADSGAAPDAASLPGMQLATATSVDTPAASTPEQEAALAEQNYDNGETYEAQADETVTATPSATKTQAEPGVEGGVVSPAAKTKGTYDYIDFYECQRHDKQAGSSLGWTKNHYAWCQDLGVVSQKILVVDNVRTVVATLSMLRMIRGSTTRENRTMKIRENNYSITTTGDWRFGVGLESVITCGGYPSYHQCDVDGGGYATVKTGSGQGVNYTVSSSPTGSEGKEKRGTGVFKPWSNFYEEGLIQSIDGYEQGYRCDSASYTDYGSACIFDRVEGTLTYDRKDSKVNEAAKHMYDALNNPEKTYPKFNGKSVPSRMHRMYYDKSQQTRNHNAAVKVCKAQWGDDYTNGGKECDEFPFKTTREGAAAGNNRFSARPIAKGDNGAAGNDLGRFFDTDHILDGDAFHVKVK